MYHVYNIDIYIYIYDINSLKTIFTNQNLSGTYLVEIFLEELDFFSEGPAKDWVVEDTKYFH